MQIERPNTRLDLQAFRSRLMICAGEDASMFLSVCAQVLGKHPVELYQHRCYRFWHIDDVLLAWTGIGTACIEPLLREYCLTGDVERVALVGTAGLSPSSNCRLGEAHPIASAFCRACAINSLGVRHTDAFTPRVTDMQFPEHVTIGSSDFYYPIQGDEQFDDVDLVDMETAQFYYLCRDIANQSTDGFDYISFKGAANELGHPEQQEQWTAMVMNAAVTSAYLWLRSPSD